MLRVGKTFVISAPSGAGKTSLCSMLLEKYKDIKYSVSYTTREPRNGELNSQDYHFISKSVFNEMIRNNEFVEWAKVHSDYYGTTLKVLEDAEKRGEDIILDIDPQGASLLRKKLNHGVYIFILVPDIKNLEERLKERRSESEDKLKIRLDNAKQEIMSYQEYDYCIINNTLDKAFEELQSIYIAEHCRVDDIDNIKNIINLEE